MTQEEEAKIRIAGSMSAVAALSDLVARHYADAMGEVAVLRAKLEEEKKSKTVEAPPA